LDEVARVIDDQKAQPISPPQQKLERRLSKAHEEQSEENSKCGEVDTLMMAVEESETLGEKCAARPKSSSSQASRSPLKSRRKLRESMRVSVAMDVDASELNTPTSSCRSPSSSRPASRQVSPASGGKWKESKITPPNSEFGEELSIDDMHWRYDVDLRMNEIDENLETMREGVKDDIMELREQVQDLNAMMRRLLERFHIEEKF
jgi:hypothetical protein